MNNTIKKLPWKSSVAALALAFVGVTVVRAASQPAGNRPQLADVRAAQSDLRAPPGQREVRAPASGDGWIAGNALIEPADREVRVAVSAAGRVAHIAAREGQFVRAGDVLVELESSVERAALGAATADVQVARAELARTQHGNRREDRAAAHAEVDVARGRAALSTALLARTQSLSASGNATQEELDRASAQASIDAASLRQIEARRDATVRGSRAEDIALALARLRASEARRDQATAQLERLIVRAPSDGEVLQLKVRAGEYASPNSEPVVVLGDTRSLRARIDVDERDFARVRVGATAEVSADAFGERRFRGRVVEVARRFGRRNVRTDDPSERVDTKILEVVVELSEREGLVPGQRVTGFVHSTR